MTITKSQLADHIGPDTELAADLSTTRQQVHHARRRFDIAPNGLPVWTDRRLLDQVRRDGEENREIVDRALRALVAKGG